MNHSTFSSVSQFTCKQGPRHPPTPGTSSRFKAERLYRTPFQQTRRFSCGRFAEGGARGGAGKVGGNRNWVEASRARFDEEGQNIRLGGGAILETVWPGRCRVVLRISSETEGPPRPKLFAESWFVARGGGQPLTGPTFHTRPPAIIIPVTARIYTESVPIFTSEPDHRNANARAGYSTTIHRAMPEPEGDIEEGWGGVAAQPLRQSGILENIISPVRPGPPHAPPTGGQGRRGHLD